MSRPRPEIEPTTQKRYSSSVSASRSTSALVNDCSSALTAAPASTRVTGLGPPRVEPIAKTAAVASPAPTRANQVYPATEPTPSATMPTTTANAAPAETPSSPGSANGLRVWPCINAPATPRQLPASRPSSVLGTRSPCTMPDAGDPSGSSRTSTTRPSGRFRLPTTRLSTAATRSSASSSASPRGDPVRHDETAVAAVPGETRVAVVIIMFPSLRACSVAATADSTHT